MSQISPNRSSQFFESRRFQEQVADEDPQEISENPAELNGSLAPNKNTSAYEREDRNLPYLVALKSSRRKRQVEAQESSQIRDREHLNPREIHESDLEPDPQALEGNARARRKRSFFGSLKEYFVSMFKGIRKTKVRDWLEYNSSLIQRQIIAAQFHSQMYDFRLLAKIQEMSIWRKEYEEEKIREAHDWNYYGQYRGVAREARLQKVEDLEKRARDKEAEAAQQLERKIIQLKIQAKEESFRPWAEADRINKIDEAHKWPINREPHGLPREPYKQQLQRTKEELKRRDIEQKQVVGLGEPRSYHDMAGKPGKAISDPVNVVTGEFYVHAVDLKLSGPMPFEIGRNYSSQLTDSADFGPGWKSTFHPYMHMSKDKSVIHIADADGSVIAYIQDPKNLNRWIPTIQENAHLNNIQGETIGSVGNIFHAFIEKTELNSETLYTLQSPAGDKRTFKVRRFTKDSNTNEKICLEKWEDHRGNYYSFHYGDEGQLSQIRSSNSQSATFTHDAAGRITKISTGEGENMRSVQYRYNASGGVKEVTSAEGASVKYEYEEREISVDHQKQRAHLLVREEKPNGRILKNTYDDRGRVLKQSATVGDNSEPVQNATFEYNLQSDPDARTITGHTEITDVHGQKTKYEYERSLVTKITDPLGNTIEQEWHTSAETAPGHYPRSLKKSKDKRGLWTHFKYDTKGNLIEKSVQGNLTGAKSDEVALTRYSYNKNHQPTSILDPLGNEIVIAYEDTNYPWLPTRIERKVQGTLTSSTQNTYYQVSEDGKSVKGLLQKVKQVAGTEDEAITEYTHNSQGLIASEKRYTGMNEEHLLTRYTYNPSGQLIEETDSSGAIIRYAYTPTGKQSKWEHLDEKGVSLSTTNIKYNKNGEPEQIEDSTKDTIRYQYDRAGRPKEEEYFKSQQSDPYYKIAYQHDPFGNLTKILKNGHSIKMTYDKIGQMLTREGETFNYEKGGEISSHTNALGGVTEKEYTSEGKLRWQKNPDGSVQEWRYQLDGRLAKEILSNGTYWETTYNDIGRTVIRTLKDASHQILTQESYTFDRRGNLISHTDGEGHTFLKQYDKLNRLKTEMGPPATPQAAQQRTTITYDDHKRTITTTNALGEKQILTRDAIGRATSLLIKNADGQTIRESTYTYSPGKIIETNGSISTTTTTDNTNHSVTKTYADGNKQQIFYNYADNSISFLNELGERSTQHYDHSQRLLKTTPPSNSRNKREIHYTSDPAGNLSKLNMPQGLSWNATYSPSGQQLSEKLSRAGQDTRQKSHTYYTSGPNIGKLQMTRDPRGLEHAIQYDSFGRVKQIDTTGTAKGTQKFTYDRRGLLTAITQTSDHSDPIHIARTYSPYGDLIEETITHNNQPHQKTTQKWDAAGRRTQINSANLQQEFSYRADGQLAQTRLPGQNITIDYIYGLDGLLKEKKQGNISQKLELDNRGRIQKRTTQINNTPFLTETLGWRANSTLSNYQTEYLGTPSYNKIFTYNIHGQLLSETYPNKTNNGILTYAFDGDTENAGLGVRMRSNYRVTEPDIERLHIGNFEEARLRTVERMRNNYKVIEEDMDPWRRPSKMLTDNGTLKTEIRGKALPNVKTQAILNGEKYSSVKANSARRGELWSIPLTLQPGDYTLKAEAYDPNTLNLFRTGALWPFTVGSQPRTVHYEYDEEGNRTKKIVNSTPTQYDSEGRQIQYIGFTPDPDSQLPLEIITDRAWGHNFQILKKIYENNTTQYTWDAWGRLTKVTYRDQENQGYEWRATHDPFGRRLKTTYTPVIADVPATEKTQTTLSYFDPEVEFLEIGVKVNDAPVTWKAYGVDKDGTYGGLQGIGGLEAIIEPNKTYSVINDALGNMVATHDGTETKKVPIQAGAYGPLPGSLLWYLSPERKLHEVTHWQGKRMDPTGLISIGARYYDPESGQFVEPDPYGHFGSLDLFSYSGNDAVNYCDPDGRFGKAAFQGATKGDYYEPTNTAQAWGKGAGQFAAGLVPYYGQAADVRDLTAAVNAGRTEGWNLRTGVGVAMAGVAFVPGVGDAARSIVKPLLKATPTSAVAKGPAQAFEVGTANDLIARSVRGDKLEVHHVGQAHPLEQIVPGYNRATAPAIVVPRAQHITIPTVRGPYTGTARDQLAKDIWDLRNYTEVPNSSLRQLIEFNKRMYPEAYTRP